MKKIDCTVFDDCCPLKMTSSQSSTRFPGERKTTFINCKKFNDQGVYQNVRELIICAQNCHEVAHATLSARLIVIVSEIIVDHLHKTLNDLVCVIFRQTKQKLGFKDFSGVLPAY